MQVSIQLGFSGAESPGAESHGILCSVWPEFPVVFGRLVIGGAMFFPEMVFTLETVDPGRIECSNTFVSVSNRAEAR